MATRRQREQRETRKTDARQWAKEQTRGFESKTIKLPDGIEFYKLEPGTHLVDFMPYIAGEGNPRADAGYEHFERTYTAHRIPGANGRPQLYCCRWECFGEKCPACLKANDRDTSSELQKQLYGTTRHLWLVNDKPGSKKNPLKVFDSNHINKGNGFGEQMADAINAVARNAKFADLQEGLTLQLTVKELTFPGGKYNAVTRIDFLPRDYEYPQEMLDKAPCLDEMLIDVGYKEMQRLLDQGTAEEDEDDTPTRKRPPVNGDDEMAPRKKAKAQADDEDEDEDEEEDEEIDTDDEEEDIDADDGETAVVIKKGKGKKAEPTADDYDLEEGDLVEYDDKECEIVKISGDGTSLTLEDEDGETIKAVSPAEVEKIEGPAGKADPDDDDEEDEDEDPPTKKGKPGKTKSKAISTTDDDDEDDDEDEDEPLEEEDDEPVAKKRGRPAKAKR